MAVVVVVVVVVVAEGELVVLVDKRDLVEG